MSAEAGPSSLAYLPTQDPLLYPARGRVRTACRFCFKRKTACKVRPNEQRCERCARANLMCTWETDKRPSPPRNTHLPLLSRPATPLTARLMEFVLTDSLANHLLQTFRSRTNEGVRPSTGGLTKVGLNGLLQRSPRVFTHAWSSLQGSEEVLALVCMLQSASVSTHSGVIGPRGYEMPPYQNQGMVSHPLMWVGKQREDVLRALRTLLLLKSQQMVDGLREIDPTTSHMIITTLLALLIDQEDVLQFYQMIEGALSRHLAGVIGRLQDPAPYAANAREVMRALLRVPPLCGAVCLLPHRTIIAQLTSALPREEYFPLLTNDLIVRLVGAGPAAHQAQAEYIKRFRETMAHYEFRLMTLALTGTRAYSASNKGQFWKIVNQIIIALRSPLDGMSSSQAYYMAVEQNPSTGPHHFLHILSSSLWGTLMMVSGFHRDTELPPDRLYAIFDLVMSYLTHFSKIYDSFPFWEYNVLILKGLPLFFSWFKGASLSRWATENPREVERVLPFMRMASFSSGYAAGLVEVFEICLRSDLGGIESSFQAPTGLVSGWDADYLVQAALEDLQ